MLKQEEEVNFGDNEIVDSEIDGQIIIDHHTSMKGGHTFKLNCVTMDGESAIVGNTMYLERTNITGNGTLCGKLDVKDTDVKYATSIVGTDLMNIRDCELEGVTFVNNESTQIEAVRLDYSDADLLVIHSIVDDMTDKFKWENETDANGYAYKVPVALRDIQVHGVHKGDRGGKFYGGSVLSLDGNCWVDEHSIVMGNFSVVKGDTLVKSSIIVDSVVNMDKVIKSIITNSEIDNSGAYINGSIINAMNSCEGMNLEGVIPHG